MRLKTLGGLTLEPGDFSRPKPLLLLAYLTVEGAKEKRHLYELFWPGAANPANSLRVVTKLIRDFGPDLLSGDERTLGATVESDIAALQTALANGNAEKAAELYGGAFLAEFSLPDWGAELEEWVGSTREFINARVRAAFIRQAETEAATGTFDLAARWAERAYDLSKQDQEPEDLERLYPLLRAGNSALGAEVKKQAAEYGLELNLGQQEAREKYFVAPLEGQPEPQAVPNNLPRAKTSFIGRDPELIELGRMLDGGEARLITLLGPGGIGKTRLSLELADGQLREASFPHGVYFVALDALAEPDQILPALAQTLGLKVKDGPLESVKTGIGRKRMLLVLDNFEHLTDGALVISKLLESCPNLSVIVTSRERLNLEEEFVLALEGLPLPNDDRPELDTLEYNDAVRLFVQRARRARLDFALTTENLPDVLNICRYLEGSPLGIELAAVWLRSLQLSDLARDIRAVMDELETPFRNVAERHQSLRAVFGYSWRLLKPKEQTTLARLTVFLGGFTREAAAQVCDATIPHLTSLVDKSLLRLSADGRYDFHAQLHQFAHEKLTADPALLAQAQRTHLAYFLRFAEANDARMGGPEQMRAATVLQAEQENLRSALSFAVASGQVEASLRLAVALGQFWETRGHDAEGRQAMRGVLALDGSAFPDLRARALNLAGSLSAHNHPDEAAAAYQEAFELTEQQGDRRGTAAALRGLGRVASLQGRYDQAQTHFEASLALLREQNDPAQLAHALNNLAINHVYLEERPRAQALFAEALEVHRSHGDRRGMGRALTNLGAITQELGDFEAAEGHYREALAIARSFEALDTEAHVIENLAVLAERRDDPRGALAHHRAALEIMVRLGNAHDALWALVNCAHAEQRLGNFASALRIAGAVEAQLEALNLGFPDYHKVVLTEVVEVSTRAVGAREAEAFRREGQSMSLLEVVALIAPESASTVRASIQDRAPSGMVSSGTSG